MNNPVHIVVDSSDGCGKSTLIQNVIDTWDVETYGPIKALYDPGVEEGHPMNIIRSLVKKTEMLPETELLLFQACRLELADAVNEAMNLGYNIIQDRSNISTYVYQCKMKGQTDLFNIIEDVFQSNQPDINIVLQAPFDVVSKRLQSRFQTDTPNDDKFKRNELFRRQVWVHYNTYVSDHLDTFGLEASGSEEEVLAGFYELLEGRSII
jgi:thymidylate kinase